MLPTQVFICEVLFLQKGKCQHPSSFPHAQTSLMLVSPEENFEHFFFYAATDTAVGQGPQYK